MADTKPKPLPALSAKTIQRFWEKVDKTPGHGPRGDCWKWTGGHTFGTNYGTLAIVRKGARRVLRANRIAYFLLKGEDPYPFHVCHQCDWPPCCNGSHLFKGTQEDNNKDMHQKGRCAYGDSHGSHTKPERVARGDRHGRRVHPETILRGERSPNAKLSTEQVRQIRLLRKGGLSQDKVAIHFGVSRGAIKDIDSGKTWKYIQ